MPEANEHAYVSMQELDDRDLAELHGICCAQDWHHVAIMVERFV